MCCENLRAAGACGVLGKFNTILCELTFNLRGGHWNEPSLAKTVRRNDQEQKPPLVLLMRFAFRWQFDPACELHSSMVFLSSRNDIATAGRNVTACTVTLVPGLASLIWLVSELSPERIAPFSAETPHAFFCINDKHWDYLFWNVVLKSHKCYVYGYQGVLLLRLVCSIWPREVRGGRGLCKARMNRTN